jgi:hypothetical protein
VTSIALSIAARSIAATAITTSRRLMKLPPSRMTTTDRGFKPDHVPSFFAEGVRAQGRQRMNELYKSGIWTMSVVLLMLISKVLPVAAQPVVQSICVGSPIPHGWVIINMTFAAGQCGNRGGPIQGAVTNDVIQNISQLPVGATVEICADTSFPVGWVVTVGRSQDVTKCHGWGAPPQFTVEWIKRIQ